MGITSLSSALSGLKVNQQQIDIISNNISNVGTEGYTRKILPQSTQVVENRSIGVLPGTVVRNVDLGLERDLWTQISAVSSLDIKATYLGRVDQFHGAPGANISVAAEISKLKDSFAALANAPDDQFLLTDVVDQAQDTARKINDLADLYTTLRNDAQNEADSVVQDINDLLIQIAEYNADIRFAGAAGRTTASTQDIRDQAVKELSELMDVSIFARGDGVLVVQTAEGVELAGEGYAQITFRPTPLSPQTGYPSNAAGLYVGDPLETPTAIEITQTHLGGKLGGLIELRDEQFPKMIAQIDELAHKMALRFEAQGLRLFTDQAGSIPLDTPPDTSTNPVTPVEYIGFASNLRVNNLVINNPSLIQTGTYGSPLQSGANDIIRRVIEFTFGDTDYQIAANTDPLTSVDIRSAATGATTLQDWLGLDPTNNVTSGVSLSNYTSVADIVAAGGAPVFGTGVGGTDTFILRFDDPDFGGGPYDIEIDLSTVVVTGTSAAGDLVNHIMADADWAAAVADFDAAVSVGPSGELVIDSRGNIEVVQSPVQPISDQGLAFLGLGFGLSEAEDPYFEVSVGNNPLTRITIEPNDTEVELLAKLNAIDGLAVQIDADGFLSLRPGETYTNPDFGGDLTIVGGPFSTNTASLGGTAAGRAALDDGVNIVQALFGTYQVFPGPVIEDQSPITNVGYQSETEVGSGVFVPFRNTLLGPEANIDTEISTAIRLTDYSQKIVNEVAQELSLIGTRQEDAETLRNVLEQQFLNESGVNIDEELGHLIVIQNAYVAATRVITAVDELFQELLSTV